jgi:hypothetical protein
MRTTKLRTLCQMLNGDVDAVVQRVELILGRDITAAEYAKICRLCN